MTIQAIAQAKGVSETTARRRMRDYEPKRYITETDANGSGHKAADFAKSTVAAAFTRKKR